MMSESGVLLPMQETHSVLTLSTWVKLGPFVALRLAIIINDVVPTLKER